MRIFCGPGFGDDWGLTGRVYCIKGQYKNNTTRILVSVGHSVLDRPDASVNFNTYSRQVEFGRMMIRYRDRFDVPSMDRQSFRFRMANDRGRVTVEIDGEQVVEQHRIKFYRPAVSRIALGADTWNAGDVIAFDELELQQGVHEPPPPDPRPEENWPEEDWPLVQMPGALGLLRPFGAAFSPPLSGNSLRVGQAHRD